jgi:hypothetical protein
MSYSLPATYPVAAVFNPMSEKPKIIFRLLLEDRSGKEC